MQQPDWICQRCRKFIELDSSLLDLLIDSQRASAFHTLRGYNRSTSVIGRTGSYLDINSVQSKNSVLGNRGLITSDAVNLVNAIVRIPSNPLSSMSMSNVPLIPMMSPSVNSFSHDHHNSVIGRVENATLQSLNKEEKLSPTLNTTSPEQSTNASHKNTSPKGDEGLLNRSNKKMISY